MNEYVLSRYHRLMEQWRKELGGKCIDCGSTSDLEFDHVEPSEKSFTISSGWSMNIDLVREELSKCVLRCSTCHKSRSVQQYAVPHGGGKAGKKGCSCESCRAKRKEYMKRWKDNRS